MLHACELKQRTHFSDSAELYERRVVVEGGSVKTITRSVLSRAEILKMWLPNSIVILETPQDLFVKEGFEEDLEFLCIVFESNSRLTRIRWLTFSTSSLQSILIPRNVEILESCCFQSCRSLSSITFESNSHLTRIGSNAFYGSSLESIMIPSNVEILESYCFADCDSLLSITFESNSHLTRIESSAFSSSSLQSIVIPRNVQFIAGSAFRGATLSSISIESGNDIFVIENDFLIDVLHHKLIRAFSESSEIEIPKNVEILGSNCWSWCRSLLSITFESNSRLTRIEFEAFSASSIQSIVIPRNVQFIDGSAFDTLPSPSISIELGNDIFVVENEFLIDVLHHKLIRALSQSSEYEIARTIEILGSSCFLRCRSLSSITFESNSRLTRIEPEVFSFSSLQSIVIPRNVQFIAGSAFIGATLSSISIESGNNIFVIENDFLIDVLHHKLIRAFSESSEIEIARTIEILGSKCCSSPRFLSIMFESNPRLTRIESEAFSWSSLQSILIPSSVEILESKCFSNCRSLSTITFETNSQLTTSFGFKVISEEAFSYSGLISIVIPANVRIIEKRAFYCCFSLTELLWADRSKIKVIAEEAFEATVLNQLVIPGSLQYIEARMCPETTELLLTSESKIAKFERWKALFLVNRTEVMGKLTGYEMEGEGTDETD
jgi:predicted metal-binding protein